MGWKAVVMDGIILERSTDGWKFAGEEWEYMASIGLRKTGSKP